MRIRFAVMVAAALNMAVAASAYAQRAAVAAPSNLPLVILVRHAEKAAQPADDPSLTPEGTARARALDSALMQAGVTKIITTEFKRTNETAAPLGTRLGLAPQVVNVRPATVDIHAQAVAAEVRKSTGVVLVVGHSNTIPAIIAALGGERMRDICESDFANLFVLAQAGPRVSVVKSHYGAPDKPAAAPGVCGAMR